MEHAAHALEPATEQLTDLGSIAIVAAFAVFLGLFFIRLRQPPIVGYILAGVLLGPTGFGFIHHSHSITILAELGVLLLLFLIGMEISIRAFVLVLRPAVIIAGGQVAAGMAIAGLFGWLLSWSVAQMVLLGFIVALSSTAVAIKLLEEIGELRTQTGRIAIGVLVAQDIAIVPMLIIAEGLGGDGGLSFDTAFVIAASVGLLGLLIWYLNRPGKIRLPFTAQMTGKPDMIALAALAMCFCAGAISSLFGLSPVYGAFIAGLVVSNSTLRGEAIELTYPVQSILVFVFFLSIGLLIDLNYIVENWVTVTTFTLAAIAAKTVLNIVLVHWSGFKWPVAFPAGLAMAQIGEFSFILAAVGLRNGALDIDTYRLALAVIALSLLLSPLWMMAARRFHDATAQGLTDFREAMLLAYKPEIEEFLRGKNRLWKARYRARAWFRAMRAARRGLRRRTTASEPIVGQEAAAEMERTENSVKETAPKETGSKPIPSAPNIDF